MDSIPSRVSLRPFSRCQFSRVFKGSVIAKRGMHKNSTSELPLSKLVVRKTRKSIVTVFDTTKLFSRHDPDITEVRSSYTLPPLLPTKDPQKRKKRLGACEETQCSHDDFPQSPTAAETLAEVEFELQHSS